MLFSHDLVKIGPGRINALTPDIVTLVEHIIKNLDAKMGHADLIDIRKTKSNADIHLLFVFHHRVYLIADIAGWFLDAQ